MSKIHTFFKEYGISEVEAVIPDMAGVARGKIMPAEKFAEEEGMRLPESIFLQTVTGDYPADERAINPAEIDIVLKGDPNAVHVVPWAAEATAQVIHDSFYSDGVPVPMAPQTRKCLTASFTGKFRIAQYISSSLNSTAQGST